MPLQMFVFPVNPKAALDADFRPVPGVTPATTGPGQPAGDRRQPRSMDQSLDETVLR